MSATISGMSREFWTEVQILRGLEKIQAELTENLDNASPSPSSSNDCPFMVDQFEISWVHDTVFTGANGLDADTPELVSFARKKIVFLRDFLAMPEGRLAILRLGQNAFDLNWFDADGDEGIYLYVYSYEDGRSEPNYILKPCRFHGFNISQA